MAAERAVVLSGCSPSHTTGNGRTGTGCSAWSLHRGLQGAFTTHRGEVTGSVPSSAHEAMEAGYLILPGIESGEGRLLSTYFYIKEASNMHGSDCLSASCITT